MYSCAVDAMSMSNLFSSQWKITDRASTLVPVVRFASLLSYVFHRRLGLTTWTDDSWRIIKYGSLERKVSTRTCQLVRRQLSNDRRRKNGDEFFLYFRATQLFHHQANVFILMFLLRSEEETVKSIEAKVSAIDRVSGHHKAIIRVSRYFESQSSVFVLLSYGFELKCVRWCRSYRWHVKLNTIHLRKEHVTEQSLFISINFLREKKLT